MTSLIGLGYSDTITPPVILRNVLENPAWYTAYTPYQPEISQGRLEALLNFQTMVSDLTGMDLANASLLDEPTAAAEAMALLAPRQRRRRATTFFVDAECHPQTIEVVRTRAEPIGIDVVVGDPDAGPARRGRVRRAAAVPGHHRRACATTARWSSELHAQGTLVAVAADLLALVLLAPPGEWGADVVVGSAQRFGVPIGFGGPHAGFFATRDEYQRNVPGRLVGVSVDAAGRPALRLALQTREQHIRREKATSNICTAQVLLASIAGHVRRVPRARRPARRSRERVHALAACSPPTLADVGIEVVHDAFFDTITVRVPVAPTRSLAARARRGRQPPPSSTPTRVGDRARRDHDAPRPSALVLRVVRRRGDARTGGDAPDPRSRGAAAHVARSSRTRCSARTTPRPQMLRYLRRLADRDLALDRTMIPLGSCTMKLNATTEMIPVTWPEFARHAPVRAGRAGRGLRRAVRRARSARCARSRATTRCRCSPTPARRASSRACSRSARTTRARGEAARDVCLIPESAHGTNAASAVDGRHAGGRREVRRRRQRRLRRPQGEGRTTHADRLAALMVTYPSTHGVFEANIRDVCAVVHECGGQVYLDGANLNALVGVAKPGKFGADVSHLNLHKTFCIPHGGGGPGVGPVAVREHLRLPNHPARRATVSARRRRGRPGSSRSRGPTSR